MPDSIVFSTNNLDAICTRQAGRTSPPGERILFDSYGAKQIQTARPAVPELLYLETAAAEWRFPQENATSYGTQECTLTLEPL
jgi:hypothetical protein